MRDPNPLPRAQTAQAPPRPSLELASPLWWSALALLVINDHLLKGAGWLPGSLTGKISDFAGLLMLPALLAFIFSLRSRRALLYLHGFVALTFSAFQLNPWLAARLVDAAAIFGINWQIWSDPGDLIALPVLALSYLRLTRTSVRPALRPTFPQLQRTVQLAGLLLGLVATVATSRPCDDDECGGEDFDEQWEDVFGEVFVHNGGTFDQEVLVSEPAENLELDCEAIADDPGALLKDNAFRSPKRWQLPPSTFVGFEVPAEADCHFVRVSVPGAPNSVIFWLQGEFEGRFESAHSGRHPGSHVIGIRQNADGSFFGFDDGAPGLRSQLRELSTEAHPSCVPPSAGNALAWQFPSQREHWWIHDIKLGLDECFALELGNDPDGEADTRRERAYLCMPPDAMILTKGQGLIFSRYHQIEQGYSGLRIDVVDSPTSLTLIRTTGQRAVDGIRLKAHEDQNCDFSSPDVCGGPRRNVSVSAALDDHPAKILGAGDPPTRLSPFGHNLVRTITLLRSEARAYDAWKCELRPPGLQYFEYVLTETVSD